MADELTTKADYDPRKDPKAGCQCWVSDKLDFPHEHLGWNILKWDFGPDMPYEDGARVDVLAVMRAISDG